MITYYKNAESVATKRKRKDLPLASQDQLYSHVKKITIVIGILVAIILIILMQ